MRATKTGAAFTRITELAIDVIFNEVIQAAKCTARTIPTARRVKRDRRFNALISLMPFLHRKIGRRIRVAKSSR